MRSLLPSTFALSFTFLTLASLYFDRSNPAVGQEGSGKKDERSADIFERQIAPIISQHCLECHDAAIKKGKLNLSRKTAAFAGGRTGPAVVANSLKDSPLWERVSDGSMPPENRPKLTDEEKAAIKAWIETGAVWTGDEIDPLAYTRRGRVATNYVQRLTVPEYIETVRTAVGVDIASEAKQLLPPDVRADGFRNTAYNLGVDIAHIEAYSTLAQIIVSRLDPIEFAKPYCSSSTLDDKTMRELIGNMGSWVLRGPMTDAEIESFLRISRAVAKEKGDFREAVGYLLEAMLQSPRFVYRMETQVGEGVGKKLPPHQLANRISYILWGAPPDRELVRAAQAGEFNDPGKMKAQIERMLKQPRAIEQSKQFVVDWLDLDRLENLKPDAKRFPKWNKQLARDLREETLAFFEEVVWRQNRPLSDLMNAQVTVASSQLAGFYGLKPQMRVEGQVGQSASSKIRAGEDALVVLYQFDEKQGNIVRDRSGHPEPIDLIIQDPKTVKWQEDGLKIEGNTLISSRSAPKRLLTALKTTSELTIEAWVTPADNKQKGPARIVSLSNGANTRNFTLGQEAHKYEMRLRTTKTNVNAVPGQLTQDRTALPELTQIVFTRDDKNRSNLYLNGASQGSVRGQGEFANWDDNFLLLVGNESSKDRPWKGTIHQIAIYSRALSAEEVNSHFQGWAKYDLSQKPERGGLLTQGSLLTMGGDEASMVARGLFVLHDLLYSGVGNPPPCVDTTPQPAKPGQSQRTMAEARLANGGCVGCHAKFEPLAFGLEKFNGIGEFTLKDGFGNKLRDDGEILFPGAEKPVKYQTSAELMDLLANSERIRKNFTRKIVQFAIGRPLVESDATAIESIHAQAQRNGGTYADVITAVILSDLVQTQPAP